jgi:hypothetical protein
VSAQSSHSCDKMVSSQTRLRQAILGEGTRPNANNTFRRGQRCVIMSVPPMNRSGSNTTTPKFASQFHTTSVSGELQVRPSPSSSFHTRKRMPRTTFACATGASEGIAFSGDQGRSPVRCIDCFQLVAASVMLGCASVMQASVP